MIAIVSEQTGQGDKQVRVFTQSQEASGATLGAALDALQLWDDEPYLLLRRFQADRFFSEAQRQQLTTLMHQWHEARDAGRTLVPELQSKLEDLIEAEEQATLMRSQALLEATRK